MKKLIVVDLLQQFIAQQSERGGPFDTADTFFAALKLFLQDEGAKDLVRDAWLKQKVDFGSENLRQEGGIPAEEVFANIRKRLEDAVAARVHKDCAHIEDDDHAIRIIMTYIDGLHSLGPTISYEAFLSYHGAQAAVERAVQVIADVVQALSPAIAAKLC